MNDDNIAPVHSSSVAGPDSSLRANGDVDNGDTDNGDIVDEWGHQSFPASDSPQNW